MANAVRMGARALLVADQRPLGRSFMKVPTVDETGNEHTELVPDEPGLQLSIVHFVDLADGRRVTTEAFGEMSLSVPREEDEPELREAIREVIFEDELREVDTDLLDEPRWPEISAVLREHGVVADDAALAALPFVVELDDDVLAALDRSS
jgi:hypothetical protein